VGKRERASGCCISIHLAQRGERSVGRKGRPKTPHDKGQQHLPGDEAWLIGEHRSSAEAFGVSVVTIDSWKIRYPEFLGSLKAGKAEADNRVERSLYERANGYNYDAVKIFMPARAKKPVYAPYVEHVPPDVTACIFWLKNRDPEHWRDVQNVTHVLGKYLISDKPMTEEQWAKERATMIDITLEADKT
jgi:hypothetical protein